MNPLKVTLIFGQLQLISSRSVHTLRMSNVLVVSIYLSTLRTLLTLI